MKKLGIFFCLISIIITLAAQTPADKIAQKMSKLQEVMEIYDDDDAMDTIYTRLNSYISQSEKQNNNAEAAIWHNYLARQLALYVQNHSWQIAERTDGAELSNDNISQWTLQKYAQEILSHFQLSLSSPCYLQNIDLQEYKSIISEFDSDNVNYSLLDFLSKSYLNYLEDPVDINIPLETFSMQNNDYFSNNQQFANIKITTPDSLSSQFHTLKTYQLLTQTYMRAGDKEKLARNTLQRLSFVFNQSSLNQKDSLYETALLNLADEYKSETIYAEICLDLGNYYYKRASKQNALKDDYVTALSWFEKAADCNRKCIADEANSRIASIQMPQINLKIADYHPQGNALYELLTTNCDSVYLAVTSVTYKEYNNNVIFNRKNLVYETVIPVFNTHLYREDTLINYLPELPFGTYVVWTSPRPYPTNVPLDNKLSKVAKSGFFQVTNIYCVENKVNDKIKYWITDRKTGEPMENVQVKLNWGNGNVQKLVTDAQGIVSCKLLSSNYKISIQKGKDIFCTESDRWYYNGRDKDKVQIDYQIFTDRKIYRPSQTIYFKGIAYKHLNTEANVVANQKIVVIFKDNNYQTLHQDTLLTNEFGSIAGEYVIPNTLPLGSLMIYMSALGENRTATEYVQVEEYKRPQFEVELETPHETFRVGSEVKLKGNVQAYAGYAISDANVSYRVERIATFPFRYYWRYCPMPTLKNQEIAQGNTVSNGDGEFEIEFTAKGENTLSRFYPAYRYEVTATVTDVNGEMHETKSIIYASNKTLLITSSIPTEIDADISNNQFKINATNLAGITQKTQINYTLSQLQLPDNYTFEPPYNCSNIDKNITERYPQYAFHHENDKSYWSVKQQIHQGTIVSSDSNNFSIANLNKLSAGEYRLTCSAVDTFGEMVTEEFYFTIIREKKAEMPIYQPLWCYSNTQTTQPGDKITLMVGSYFKKATVQVCIVRNDSILKQETLTLNGKPHSYSFNITEKDRGSITMYATMVSDGKQFNKRASVAVPFNNKKIDIQFITFRDKLHPGETTKVKMHLSGHDNAKISAELLATLYDASLDALAQSNSFDFNWMHVPTLYYQWQKFAPYYYYYGGTNRWGTVKYMQTCPSPEWRYDLINRRRMRNMMYSKAAAAGSADLGMVMEESVALTSVANSDIEYALDATEAVEDAGFEAPQTSIRSNFAETAFFLPFIQVADNGDVDIEFTMPESLTKWKMLGIAHTKDMSIGTFEKYLETQKEVMLVPNWPRFVYERDTLFLTAKVVNLTADALKGLVTLQCYDAATGKALVTVTEHSAQTFAVSAQQTDKIAFKLAIPSGIQGLTCKIVAKTDGGDIVFSDGEEVTLPVLSKRMLVTEALPIYITRAGTKQFDLKLPFDINSEDFKACTFQFTPDPKWNAVLAIPYLMSYPYECNEQTFNRLYANILTKDIIKQNPKLETLLSKYADTHPEAFCSKLSQDEELKQILLTETPWVNDAQNEEEAMQNIFTLFNQKVVEKNILQAIRKLEFAQNHDGGWPWFSNGRSSSYITEYLLAGAGRLLEKNVVATNNQFLSKSTLNKAVRYIDNELETEYQNLKKHHPELLKETGIDAGTIHYLYTRSFYLKQVKADNESYSYFLKKLEKEASDLQSIYLKSMAAMTLYRVGMNELGSNPTVQAKNSNTHIKLAKQLMNSIKARAQHSEEMGMFWKKQGAGYYWYEAPIERQALLIDAFQMILQDEASVQEMKIWLLQQKRTQSWGTTRNTAEACHALLSQDLKVGGANESEITVQVCDDKFTFVDTLQLPIKQEITSCIKDNSSKKITLCRENNALSYGAVFYQYYQDMDKISAADANMPLAVDRDIYRVDLNERGEVLTPLNEQNSLHVGDKVRVRITISCDRDLEFVHLKDLRAAAFEPMTATSCHRYQDGLYYYESYKDASVNFFFDWLPKGKYVFEYTMFVTQAGTFNSGYATMQCMYAPEFVSHSKSRQVTIGD